MWIDIIGIIVLALGFYIGYTNGLLGIVLKLVLIILAFLLALRLFPIIFLFLENTIADVGIMYFILGFLIVMIVVISLYKFSSNRIERWLVNHSRYISTKIIGGLVLSFFILMISSFLVGRLMRLHVLKPGQMEDSYLFPVTVSLDQHFNSLLSKFNETISRAFEDNVHTINKLEKKQKMDSTLQKQ